MDRFKFLLITTIILLIVSGCSGKNNRDAEAEKNESSAAEDYNLSETEQDDILAFCQEADTLYYNALYGLYPCDFESNLQNSVNEYKIKTLNMEIEARKKVKLATATLSMEYSVLDSYNLEDDVYFIRIAATRFLSYGGEMQSTAKFLVKNENGVLKIVDWFDERIDSIDIAVMGEDRELSAPDVWEDEEWVKQINSKLDSW